MSTKSSSSSSQNQETTDKRIAATDSAIVVTLDQGADFTLNTTDAGVVEAGTEVINAALSTFENLLGDVLGFAVGAGETSLNFAKEERAATRDFVDANRSEGSQVVTDIVQYGAMIGAAYFISKALKG